MPENRLLAALPLELRKRWLPRMTTVTLQRHDILHRAGNAIDFVYFPLAGGISSVLTMLDGQSAETMLVGNEGMIGAATVLGASKSPEKVFCQIPPCEVRRWPVREFLAEACKEGPLQSIVFDYLYATIRSSALYTACNSLHTVEQRMARWLLISQDRMGNDEYLLTQELLAIMLGVRRATVNGVAVNFQSDGLIQYHHGRLKILDRKGLMKRSCECYESLVKVFVRPASSLSE